MIHDFMVIFIICHHIVINIIIFIMITIIVIINIIIKIITTINCDYCLYHYQYTVIIGIIYIIFLFSLL